MENGIWRTVGGRRIFIKNGQDLATAMKESGKFKIKNGLYSKYELDALQKYISPDALLLNEKLRNNEKLNSSELEWVKHLDNALAKTPNYHGLIVRDMELVNTNNFMKNIKVGSFFTTNQYLSFSTGKEFNDFANIKIFIKNSKHSKNLVKINTIGEDEVLYERNKKFKVLSVVERNDIIFMEWEEADDI